MKNRIKSGTGFTLIELIATIAIAGIIMIMILPYFQSGITESHRPAQWLQDAVALQRAMESITGSYRAIKSNDSLYIKKKTEGDPPGSLDTLSANIGPAGSSFNNSFGVYGVLENGFVSFNGAGTEVAGGQRILKITLVSPNRPGYQLTRLFTVLEEFP